MRILQVAALADGMLRIVADDGRIGVMDVRPYFESAAFRPLKDPEEFSNVFNGGYFVEWKCGADLSADTIETRWTIALPVDVMSSSSSRI